MSWVYDTKIRALMQLNLQTYFSMHTYDCWYIDGVAFENKTINAKSSQETVTLRYFIQNV